MKMKDLNVGDTAIIVGTTKHLERFIGIIVTICRHSHNTSPDKRAQMIGHDDGFSHINDNEDFEVVNITQDIAELGQLIMKEVENAPK